MITTLIIAIATLLIGFGLAWVLKTNQAPADSIILKNNYDQLLIAQKEQNELIEQLRTSKELALSNGTTYKANYEQQLQELQAVKSSYQESQEMVSSLKQTISANTVKQQTAEENAVSCQQKVEQLNIALQASVNENRKAQTEIIELNSQLLTRQMELNMLKENMDQQEARIAELNKTQLLQFQNIANKILEDNTQKFTAVNEEKMNAVLTPFKTSIAEFKTKVEETYHKESQERFTLGKEIDKLVKQSSDVSIQAANLTNALKNNNKQQGNFGEMILESILENSGLIKGTQYVTQEHLKDNAGRTIKDEDGNGLQPDVMIICPDKRKIIIDSKVSFLDYEAYVNAESKEAAALALNNHVKSVKNHIIQLSRKNYPKYAEALDYVLMFMPVEPAFLEALKADTNLWKFAYDKGIVLVSPTNLLAVLKIIQEMWKVDSRNQNAEAIAQKAGDVYEKFATFLKNFESIGSALKTATAAYDDGHKQLSTGRGNFSQKVQELKNMGGKTMAAIPDKFLKEE